MKKLLTTIQKYWLYFRILRWAVVHSPKFSQVQLFHLANPPLLVDFRWSKWSDEFLIIRLRFYWLRIVFHLPWQISEEFIKTRKREGKIIDERDAILDKDVPF